MTTKSAYLAREDEIRHAIAGATSIEHADQLLAEHDAAKAAKAAKRIDYADIQATLAMRFPSATIVPASVLAAEWIGAAATFGSLTFVVYVWEENGEADWIVDTLTDDDAESTIVPNFDAAVDLIATVTEF